MYLLRMVQKGYPVPLKLTDDQISRLLGLKYAPIKLDLTKIRSVLKTRKLPSAVADVAERNTQVISLCRPALQ